MSQHVIRISHLTFRSQLLHSVLLVFRGMKRFAQTLVTLTVPRSFQPDVLQSLVNAILLRSPFSAAPIILLFQTSSTKEKVLIKISFSQNTTILLCFDWTILQLVLQHNGMDPIKKKRCSWTNQYWCCKLAHSAYTAQFDSRHKHSVQTDW
jgi:hypothetical protein